MKVRKLRKMTAITTSLSLLTTLLFASWVPPISHAAVSDPFDQKTFNLTVQNSQLRMDVNGGSSLDGAKIIQWSAGTGLNQQWKFIKTDPGYYKIISQSSSKALVVQNASIADDAGIIQNSYTQDTVYNDEWSVVDVGDGFYQLLNRGSNKVIEIPGSSGAGGVQFVQRTAGTGSNQKFLLSFDRTVNDNVTGTSKDQFTYSQGWGYSAYESGAYNGDNHYSNTVDANVVLHFTGSKVQLYGAKNNNQGIAAVSIDDGTETMVDTYASSRSDQQLLFESTGLSNQDHVLRLRVTGQKNAGANNTFISIDRADIQSRIVINYQEIADLITTAQSKHDSAVEGSQNGQYPNGSKQTLQAAIDAAKQVVNLVSVTQQQVNQAAATLSAAVQTFEDLKINASNAHSITITSATDRINVKGGSLLLAAVVQPVSQGVTWTVSEVDGSATDKATIDQSGKLTAVKDGSVKVVATATDDSALFGEKVIIITGQNDQNPGSDPTNREELNFNTGWLFERADVSGAQAPIFDDSGWEGVNLPHSVRLEPKISGGDNQSYQGFATYRRHFSLDNSYSGKKLFVEFEGAMTNAEVWVNGTNLGIHHGGYTPFSVDITNYVQLGGATNVITVKLDNRDDPQTPPGKPQSDLDFAYFGGLYRDVKLHVMDKLHVSDAVYANKVADGGIFVTYPAVSTAEATVQVKTNIINENTTAKNTSVKTTIVDDNNQVVATMVSDGQQIGAGSDHTFVQSTTITNPKLWRPDHPNMYTVYTAVNDGTDFVDSYKTRIGIRRIQFTPDQGFLINGEKLMLNGANRHQEYLYVGNAMPDSGQYRDAKLLREGGFNNVRTGHYPNDPAFLDAADELGLTVIEPTPGWQFFGDSVFQQRSYQAIRDMVRRDRNHPSIIMWESSLNETYYTQEYAQNAHNATHEEYPGDQTYTSAEYGLWGKEIYDVNYKELNTALKPLFTREWGDDWTESATSPTGFRSVRKVGETDMLNSLILRQNALNGNGTNDWAGLNANPRIAGNAVWSFNDYNRGYDNEQGYTGVVDLDRYPKFNYYFFQSQRDPGVTINGIDSGPMVFIANYWTSSSSRNVTVASNTQQVKLYLNNTLIATQNPDSGLTHIAHPTFTFNNVPWAAGTLRADGLIGGVVVASHTVSTPGQPHHLAVEYDTKGKGLVADGSDLVTAYITVRDANNNIVPTNGVSVSLNLSGPGGIIGNGVTRTFANPVAVEGGVAAAIVQSSRKSGTLKLTATANGLLAGSAEITSAASQSVFVPGGSDGGDSWFEGENVALNKAVTTSSEQSGNFGPNGNDGNETTNWSAANGDPGQWWAVDLGSVYNITGSEIAWTNGGSYYQYKIEVSEDQVNWTTIKDNTQNTTATVRQRDKLAANARYVRVTVTGVQTGQASFNEMKVFGVAPFQNQATQYPALVNVALNKSVTASSSVSGNEPTKANDGLNGSWWEASDRAPGWLQVDLGASYNLTGSKIIWGKDNIYYTYRVEVSADGTAWSQIAGRTASGQDLNPDNYTANGVRYVRLTVDSLVGGSGTEKPAIKEIQLYSNPVNLGLNKPATADSSQSNNPVAAGNDGNESSRWSANDGNVGHWYKVDLGASYDLSGTRVKWESDNKNYGYRIEVSDDNVNWTLASQNSSTQQIQFDYFNSHARYVRIQVTELSGAWASFWEFDVYGTVPIDTSLIPQSQMTATATSEETSGVNNAASQAIDGDPSTIWHTKWDSSNTLPQSIILDLGKAHVISKLKYLPRQNGQQFGNITSYELLTSQDGLAYTANTSGTWSDNSSQKEAAFAQVTARYVKLTAKAGYGGFASAAEINIVRNDMDDDYQGLAALITSAQSKHDSAIEGSAEGQHPVGSKQTLLNAINQAKQVRDNVSVTQQQLLQAKNDLTAAIQAFEAFTSVNVQTITVTSTSSTITVKGGTLQFGAEVLPSNATNKSVTWAVYETDGLTATNKATIDANGLLTAAKNGTVSVSATAIDGSGIKGSSTITISGQSSVTTISVTGEGGAQAITIKDGTLQMHATVLPAGASSHVTWSIWENDGASATNKATINASGLLTAKKDGIVKVVATATDGSGMQASNYIFISGQTALPTGVPQATLTGPAPVQAGALFSTNFGLSNVSDSVSSTVYAADITLSYNANAIEYVSVDSLKSGFRVIQTTTDVPGQIRIIAVSEGAAGAITTSGDVVKFNWKAKPNHQSSSVNFVLTGVAVSNALGQKVAAQLTEVTVSVTGVEVAVVDKTTLQTIMGIAQSIYARAIEGTLVGQYPAGTKAVLVAAINAATSIYVNPAATQEQLDGAAIVINEAIQHFNQGIIRVYELGDANEDTFIDIGDLGTVALHYGKNTGSADWNKAKAADFNHNGEIDFVDLTSIAHMILQ